MKKRQNKAYERIARRYDDVLIGRKWWSRLYMRCLWRVDDNAIAREVLQMIPPGFTGHLLDVPVGTMVFTAEKYLCIPQATVTGVDYSQAMLNTAQDRIKAMKLHNTTLRRGDVLHLPYTNNSFDGVLSMNGLHCFPNKKKALAEIFRVLKPGGFFCGSFYIQGERKPADWIVRNILNRKGLFVPPHLSKQEAIDLLQLFYGNQVTAHNYRSILVFNCMKGFTNNK